jgi:hypothetical protein
MFSGLLPRRFSQNLLSIGSDPESNDLKSNIQVSVWAAVQAAIGDELAPAVQHRHPMRGGQSDDQFANRRRFENGVARNHQTVVGLACQRLEDTLDFADLPNRSGNGRHREGGCQRLK